MWYMVWVGKASWSSSAWWWTVVGGGCRTFGSFSMMDRNRLSNDSAFVLFATRGNDAEAELRAGRDRGVTLGSNRHLDCSKAQEEKDSS